jgi:conjugative relaxase-like TrwC/TraI family protein
MSRALDPQLHTHVVAANLARGEDGRYTALHHPSLYRAARTAGYLYQSHLRSRCVTGWGLEWGPVHKGAAELAELPGGCVAGVLAAPRAGRAGGR